MSGELLDGKTAPPEWPPLFIDGKPNVLYDPSPEVSLEDEAGMRVAHNMILMSAGAVNPADCGPAYGSTADGALSIKIDKDTAARMPWNQQSSKEND